MNLYAFVRNMPVNSVDVLGKVDLTLPSSGASAFTAGTGGITLGELGLAGVILGEVAIIGSELREIYDLSKEISETNDYIKNQESQAAEQDKKNIEQAKDNIKNAKKRKDPNPKPGKKCKDACPSLCFALARLKDIEVNRRFLDQHPIPNDPFDHPGQLAEIVQGVANATGKVIEAKCDCESIGWGGY